jgi:uncharacterized protein YndB with AHSA1/START domain
MENFGEITEPQTVRLERTLPGPIERVWSYLTDSEKRGKWLASGEMELRVGGRVSLTFNNQNLSSDRETPERFKSTEGHKVEGEVTRCEPPRLLTFTWGNAGDVTFELTPKGKDVLFVVTPPRSWSRAAGTRIPALWRTFSPARNRGRSGKPSCAFSRNTRSASRLNHLTHAQQLGAVRARLLQRQEGEKQ